MYTKPVVDVTWWLWYLRMYILCAVGMYVCTYIHIYVQYIHTYAHYFLIMVIEMKMMAVVMVSLLPPTAGVLPNWYDCLPCLCVSPGAEGGL